MAILKNVLVHNIIYLHSQRY